MSYDALGLGALDYLPCRYGASKLLFRGPKRDLTRPYVAFIGGTETYGKFLEKPFAMLVEEALQITCVNLGVPNAGTDAFVNDPFVFEAAAGSEVTVVQLLGAQNMTNRFYSVHPRRNDRFVAASSLLKTIFREVDFADFHYTKHMLNRLFEVSPERFASVREELQQAWLARMRLMLKQLRSKTILLWFSDHAPGGNPEHGLGPDPLFVTREMIEEIRGYATQVVELVASPEAVAKGTDGMICAELEQLAAIEMLGVQAHEEAAEALAKAITELTG